MMMIGMKNSREILFITALNELSYWRLVQSTHIQADTYLLFLKNRGWIHTTTDKPQSVELREKLKKNPAR